MTTPEIFYILQTIIIMANFGIEGIRYFGNLRNSGTGKADDLTYVFNICNGLDRVT
jgi:hypothetical protein